MDVLRQNRDAGTLIQHHPLGFLRLPLTNPNRLAEGLYLHVWPEGGLAKQEPASPIHCHVFDLESRVLLGALINLEYQVRINSDGEFRLLEAVYEGQQSARIPTHISANCYLTGERVYEAGQVYTLPKGTFHETRVLNEPVVTLMSKFNVDIRKQPLNVMPVENVLEPTGFFDHASISQEHAWNIVMDIVELLADDHKEDGSE